MWVFIIIITLVRRQYVMFTKNPKMMANDENENTLIDGRLYHRRLRDCFVHLFVLVNCNNTSNGRIIVIVLSVVGNRGHSVQWSQP